MHLPSNGAILGESDMVGTQSKDMQGTGLQNKETQNKEAQNKEIQSELNLKAKEIERIVRPYLPVEEGGQKIVLEAVNYSFLSGGKRLRPVLMLETYRMFGGTDAVIEPFLAAIEMIHTYSLIHDDLPAMDNDEYRRGRKTTHIVYGEAIGILAGDALLNLAFETAAKAFFMDADIERTARAFQVLAKKAGVYGMIGGQVMDVQNENNAKMDVELLESIDRLKTGALIEGAMMVGGILAGAKKEDVKLLERIAANVGAAFQIQDDILDVTSTLKELGKPVGSDEKNKKTTYVTLYGLEEAKKRVESYTKEAVEGLSKLPVQSGFLKALLVYLMNRKK